MKTGKFVVILGIPQIGKTTQRNLLKNHFSKRRLKVETVEYPPELLNTGETSTTHRIKEYLQGNNPEGMDVSEFQHLNVLNKLQFEPKLRELLSENDVVIAENYIGTSIAEGMVDGLDKHRIMSMNSDLISADLTLLLDGEPFKDETNGDHQKMEKRNKLRGAYAVLYTALNWQVIRASQSEHLVSREIWDIVSEKMPELANL